MTTLELGACLLFAGGYVLIALEQRLGTHKASLALALGAALWVMAAFDRPAGAIHAGIEHVSSDIFGVIALLIAAMSLIEILAHYRFFDLLQNVLLRCGVGERGRFVILAGMTFVLSALLDNISVTIAMIQIARRLSARGNLVVTAAVIVATANAGGAWSPIGDVTSILMWLAGKYTPLELFSGAFLPALTLAVVVTALLLRRLAPDDASASPAVNLTISWSEWAVMAVALGSFGLPLAMNAFGLPPFLGLLLGLGVTLIVISTLQQFRRSQTPTHLEAKIERLIQRIDLASITYLMGILLSVGALGAMGVLETAYQAVMGPAPGTGQLTAMIVGLGLTSSLIDNTALVTMAIDVVQGAGPQQWSLLAITAGNGGSILLIGSAAGIVATGAVPELTFMRYLRLATVPVLLGFAAAIAVWLVQTALT